MITHDQAMNSTITEYHVAHAGQPCTVWYRGGISYDTDGGGFFLPVYRNEDNDDGRSPLRRDSESLWHHITGVTAGDYHVADECPHAHRMGDDQPPVSDRSENQPTLSSGYDADGYDALGFDESGFDRNGYDAEGYDAEGFDADGFDRNDRDEDGRSRNAPDASDLDLDDEWSQFMSGRMYGSTRQDAFRQHLRDLVADPDDIDNLEFCGNCNEPAWNEDLSSAAGGDLQICGSCWDNWCTCNSCDEKFPAGDLTETLSGADVCESCRDCYYTWCEYCDGYRHDEDYEHDHESGDGCCESPQPEFAIRNDGCEPLANDTRVTVTLPAGTISGEGLQAITRYLRDNGHFDVSCSLVEIGDQWQARDGNFAKRLSRLAYQRYQAKMTPDVLSQVGNIARDHSKPVSVEVEVTRDLNQDASYFYHEDSCWWGSYYGSRCALKTNGGLGLRSFDGPHIVSGRAWIMPLKLNEAGKLVATFETLTPDAFVVFNGYGDLSGYAAPRIVAHMAGWTYRRISFSADPMYVNSGGYLVAPEHIAEQYTDGSLYLSIRQHSNLFENERVLVHA